MVTDNLGIFKVVSADLGNDSELADSRQPDLLGPFDDTAVIFATALIGSRMVRFKLFIDTSNPNFSRIFHEKPSQFVSLSDQIFATANRPCQYLTNFFFNIECVQESFRILKMIFIEIFTLDDVSDICLKRQRRVPFYECVVMQNIWRRPARQFFNIIERLITRSFLLI